MCNSYTFRIGGVSGMENHMCNVVWNVLLYVENEFKVEENKHIT